MTDIQNPHDKFFKETFSHVEVAKDFCLHYLPSEIVGLLDLSTLTLAKDNFVDPELQEQFSDLLFSIRLKTGREIYIYLLFEHKSHPDRYTGLQLLGYMVQIWLRDRKAGMRKFLRPILPLVIYHGRRKWNLPLDFQELFPPIPGLEKYLPRFRYLLFDISQYGDDDIKGNFVLRVVFYLFKYIQNSIILPSKLKMINEWVRALGQERTGYDEFLKTMLFYLYNGTDALSPEDIETELQDVLEKRGDSEMPTPAEVLLERGRVTGIEIGLEKGLEKGIRESIQEFLEVRFGQVPTQVLERVSKIEDLDQLRELRKKALICSSIEEFEQSLILEK